MRKEFLSRCIVIVISTFIRLLRLTYRIKVIDDGKLMAEKKVRPVVATMWHNRLIFAPAAFPRRYRKQFATIASLSKDGKIAEMFMKNFGLEVVRGSSSRGGTKALMQLRSKLTEDETPLVITIDGPRGPKYSCQSGAAYLAAATGVPIVPYVVSAKRYFSFKNWDQTQIPFPFTKLTLITGKPVYIDKIDNKEELQLAREKIINAMLEITQD